MGKVTVATAIATGSTLNLYSDSIRCRQEQRRRQTQVCRFPRHYSHIREQAVLEIRDMGFLTGLGLYLLVASAIIPRPPQLFQAFRNICQISLAKVDWETILVFGAVFRASMKLTTNLILRHDSTRQTPREALLVRFLRLPVSPALATHFLLISGPATGICNGHPLKSKILATYP